MKSDASPELQRERGASPSHDARKCTSLEYRGGDAASYIEALTLLAADVEAYHLSCTCSPPVTDRERENLARAKRLVEGAASSPAVTVEELHGRIAWIIEQRLAVPADEVADAAKSVLSVAQPAGWKLMPRTASDAMCAYARHRHPEISREQARGIWLSMFDEAAAAPTPTVSSAREVPRPVLGATSGTSLEEGTGPAARTELTEGE